MGFFSKIFKGITNIIGDVLGFLVGADFDEQQQAEGVLVNKQSNNAAIPVIYGERKVGGTRVFVSTGGNDNEYLYIALVLAEGEVESIGDVYINDTLSTDQKYVGLYYIQKYTGTDSQTYNTVLANATDTWGSNHRLRGVAYLAIRLKYDSEVFGGIPNIQAVVKGRKVYDPRKDPTSTVYDGSGAHSKTNASTWEWSDNPALCLADYMTNERFGKGLDHSRIDLASIGNAADVCDTTQTNYTNGQSIKILTCNAVLDTNKKIFDNVKILLQGMRGLLPYQNGQYKLIIDGDQAAHMVLGPDNTYPNISIKDNGKNRKYNQVRASFVNPQANWQEDTVIWPPSGSSDETNFLSADNGEVMRRDVTLNTITNYYQARDIARIVCRASRENSMLMEATCTPDALRLEVGDVVEVDLDSLGWQGSYKKEFKILQMQLLETGDVKLTMQEHSDVYAWAVGGQADDTDSTTLPDPFNIPPPTNLTLTAGVEIEADGSTVPTLNIAWNKSPSVFVVAYIIEIKAGSNPSAEVRISTPDAAGADVTSYYVKPAYAASYVVKVRAESEEGIRSTALTGSVTIGDDTTPPNNPTSVSATGGFRTITLQWTNPTNEDLAGIIIQSSANNTVFSEASREAASPNGIQVWDDTNLPDSATRYYRLKAYDYTGNENAAFTAVVNATTLASTSVIPPRSFNGYVYYQVSTTTNSAPSTPTATAYNFETGAFTNLSSQWDTSPPVRTSTSGTAGQSQFWWSSRVVVTEDKYQGTQTIQFSSSFASINFEGLATFTNLNTELANPASSLVTTIDGGHINTGLITLTGNNVAGMAVRLGKTNYTSTGAGFWLGNIGDSSSIQPRFHIGTAGDAKFLKFDGSDVEAKGILIKDTSGNTVFDANEVDGVYIKNASVDTLQLANEAVTIPQGASGSVNVTLNTSQQFIGQCTLSYGTAGDNPTAAVAIAGIQVSGNGTVDQTVSVFLRRVYSNASYNGIHNSTSIKNDFGGQVITAGKFDIAQVGTATSVNFDVYANVNTGTRTCNQFFVAVMSSKK